MWKQITLAVVAAGLGFAQQPNDYGDAKSWLCRPGQHDACDIDLTTTVVSANGSLNRETWAEDPNAPVDCFYVYPTVSTDPTPNSDMVADEAERNVIRQQFARFASKCRPFAPMYRQITLAGLRLRLASGGGSASLEHGLQYDDVKDAWKYYLDHDNKGRGFVLIGHSQGSFVLAELIRQEIDGKPVQARMVSAILPGATMAVPARTSAGRSSTCPFVIQRPKPGASSPTRRSAPRCRRRPTRCSAKSLTKIWSPRAPIRRRSVAVAANCTRIWPPMAALSSEQPRPNLGWRRNVRSTRRG